jgi:ribonuclease T1
MTGRQRYQSGLLLLVAGLLIWWVLFDGGGRAEPDNESTSTSQSPSHDFTETNTPTTDPTVGTSDGTDPDSGLPIVQVADLPAEAADILALIDQGGPFDEDEDGGTFQNREGILPEQPRGYYTEYTVPTPGSDDRGARRIVAGEGGEFYWTDDHYRSFSRIAR